MGGTYGWTHGSGLRTTGPRTARFPRAGKSGAGTVVTNGGGGWSSDPGWLASSARDSDSRSLRVLTQDSRHAARCGRSRPLVSLSRRQQPESSRHGHRSRLSDHSHGQRGPGEHRSRGHRSRGHRSRGHRFGSVPLPSPATPARPGESGPVSVVPGQCGDGARSARRSRPQRRTDLPFMPERITDPAELLAVLVGYLGSDSEVAPVRTAPAKTAPGSSTTSKVRPVVPPIATRL